MYEDRQLAALWWDYHGKGGLIEVVDTLSERQSLELELVDNWVEAESREVSSLARIIELLASSAPSATQLAYIGTWVLENADMDGGASPEVALSRADLPSETIALIRSGYLPM